jgi:hypothetical protein
MSSKPLFGQQFEAVHGKPIDFYLQGGHKWTMGNERIYLNTPEEHDDWVRENLSTNLASKFVGARGRFEETMSTPADPRDAIKAFREDPYYVTTGDPLHVAKSIQAIDTEMRTNARENPMTLYRGAARTPQLDATRNMPVSFSESRHVAGHFAKSNRGEIFKVGHNEVKGLRMADYGVAPKTVGPNSISEAEWLIDPRSIKAN